MKHVVPLKDLKEHDLASDCWCEPIESDGVFIHNSADWREVAERDLGICLGLWGVFNDPE